MVERKEYLERLIQWKDEQVIKVVTGIRRCGKSVLLFDISYEYLISQNIKEEQIISLINPTNMPMP